MLLNRFFGIVFSGAVLAPAYATDNPAQIDWQPLEKFSIARTETTVEQFRRYVEATNIQTLAERQGGGSVYEGGWVKKSGWSWRAPFGSSRNVDGKEPAVHLTYDEAQSFCKWAGGRLPTDTEWVSAAYTEQRVPAQKPFVTGETYPYPTGDTPQGAQCLMDCGAESKTRAINHGAALWRGYGHAKAGSTKIGVNGLFDMGGNVWEWVDEPKGRSGDAERRTRGGSWWYGKEQMRAEHAQYKPGNTAVVYIGFRCVKNEMNGRQ